jgi:hypothetical protein
MKTTFRWLPTTLGFAAAPKSGCLLQTHIADLVVLLANTQGANDAVASGRSFYSLSLEFTEDVAPSKVRGSARG